MRTFFPCAELHISALDERRLYQLFDHLRRCTLVKGIQYLVTFSNITTPLEVLAVDYVVMVSRMNR